MTIENGIEKMSGVIQMRGGTYDALRTENPLLMRREVVVEVDTGQLKVGDGTTNWNDLQYAGGNNSGGAIEQNGYELTSETWIFELEDGTEIRKEVAVWI